MIKDSDEIIVTIFIVLYGRGKFKNFPYMSFKKVTL